MSTFEYRPRSIISQTLIWSVPPTPDSYYTVLITSCLVGGSYHLLHSPLLKGH